MFTFHGPAGQEARYADGRLRVSGLSRLEAWDLAEATKRTHPATPTGPFLGGDGITDPVSVYLACRAQYPFWDFTGTPPKMDIPTTDDPSVVA